MDLNSLNKKLESESNDVNRYLFLDSLEKWIKDKKELIKNNLITSQLKSEKVKLIKVKTYSIKKDTAYYVAIKQLKDEIKELENEAKKYKLVEEKEHYRFTVPKPKKETKKDTKDMSSFFLNNPNDF